jgi:hypothetical protein
MENFLQNRIGLATRFAQLGEQNPYKSNDQYNNDFKSEEGIGRLVDNARTFLGETYTSEQFIKKFACDKDAFKNSQYCPSTSSPSSGIDPIFSCIRPYFENEGRKISTHPSGRITVKTREGGNIWVFSKDKIWSKYNLQSKKITKQGKWECTGNSSFRIITDDQEWLSSDSIGWTDITVQADDSFPLKVASKGPNVVKLQKFLNDKIPTNPLTVNGLFDQKTQDKLIEFQKKEGIIE